jgi:hypothetical protein
MKYSSAAYFICFCSCLCYLYCCKAPNAVSRSLVTYWPLTYSDAVRICVVKARIWSYACFNIKVLCQVRALLLSFLWFLCSFKASKHYITKLVRFSAKNVLSARLVSRVCVTLASQCSKNRLNSFNCADFLTN